MAKVRPAEKTEGLFMKPLLPYPALASAVMADNSALALPVTDLSNRQILEGFIHQVFKRAYGATIYNYMPVLLGLRNTRGSLVTALGMRAAANQALFLEQYLRNPVEHVLGLHTAGSIRRDSIIELGNLAAIHPGSSRLLIKNLANSLYTAGYQWVVFTITASLVNSFERLGLSLIRLAPARITELPPAMRSNWGSYYDNKPAVYAGHIPAGIQQIEHPQEEDHFNLDEVVNELRLDNACSHILDECLPCLI
jgi:hypothetical protein